MVVDPAAVQIGEVRARYFRENFAQGGFDLVQIVPELVTNADAAIAASGRKGGRIVLYLGPPEPDFAKQWRAGMRTLGAPALLGWRHELRCTDDGEGMDAELVHRRLGALGVEPTTRDQRGLFGRGLRDVWLAQGGGRLESVRHDRFVESWFFPASGDEPYAYLSVHDRPAESRDRERLGLPAGGTRVTVPLAGRAPKPARFRTLVSRLVQLRPVLEDPTRELWLELPGELPQQVAFPRPEPDAEQPLLFDDLVELGGGVSARIVVRRAATPFPVSPSRAMRLGGLVIRSGRAAHEVTLGSHAGRHGARRLYGEVWCDAIERLQREALGSARPQVVVKVDRSGLNENHPMVARLYRAIDRVLAPLVAEEERREDARTIATDRTLKRSDEQGLRALNDALRAAFQGPGAAPVVAGGRGHGKASSATRAEPGRLAATSLPEPVESSAAVWFKQSPMRLHPGEIRGASLLFDPERVAPGTKVELAADQGLWVSQRATEVPRASSSRPPRLAIDLRVRVSVEPGTRLTVLAEAGGHTAELVVVVVRHTSSGWVREIVRKDRDSEVEAEFDPESGVVTVYEGRTEFRDLERAARRRGIARKRVREYVPYRMLEVEAAANAVYSWAAQQIVGRRLNAEPFVDPAEYARAIMAEAQRLRHRTHRKLMHAFLDPAVFEGRVRIEEEATGPPAVQVTLPAG